MIDAAETLWAMLGVSGGWLRLEHEDGRVMTRFRAEDRRYVDHLRFGLPDVFVSPAKRTAKSSISKDVPFLCVLSASKASERLLGRFHPEPTLVLREGRSARLTCLWALDRGLPVAWTREANRRLAHYAKAPKKMADPDDLRFRPPGSMIRQKRREVPVLVEYAARSLYRPREVVGSLPQSPNPDAWRERAA